MKIAVSVFYKNTYNNNKTGVWGDEIVSNSMCEYLRSLGYEADTYTKEELLENKVDICIHTTHQIFNPCFLPKVATRNILWIQGFSYKDDFNIASLDDIYNWAKDYYEIVTSSRVLARKYGIPFIIPYTGCEKFHKVQSDYNFDVSFIGNIIKPFDTNSKYLRPLNKFNFELYGGDFGKISHEEALKVISGSKINLHYGFKETIEWDMVTGRPLFLSLCEAFTIMDNVPWFMETFKDAMLFTSGGDDEKEKIEECLKDTDKMKKMAKMSYEIIKSLKPTNILKEIGV